MAKEEFNLSEKLRGSKTYGYYDEEDVKEFIKRLKKMIDFGGGVIERLIHSQIDKLAGDKLF